MATPAIIPDVTDEQLLSGGTPAQPSPRRPVHNFFSNFLYGGGQALLQHAGLKTDDEKQEFASKLGLQQYQADTQRQTANDLSQVRDAQAAHLQGQADALTHLNTPYTFDKDDQTVPAQFRGLATTIGGADAIRKLAANLQSKQDIADTKADAPIALAKYYQEFGGDPKTHQFRSVNGRIGLYNRMSGELVKDIGADTAMITGPRNAEARARAGAQYGVANVMDLDGDPTAVSRLEQLRTGAPTVTEKQAQQIQGDKLGTTTYLAANRAVKQNLHVLDDVTQRGLVAQALDDSDHNPGMAKSILQAYLQKGMTPETAKFTSSLLQMTEFGPTFKKLTGNGGSSTDSLRATIKSNQPNAARSYELNRNLLEQDEKLATGALRVQNAPNRYAVPVRGGAPAPAGSNASPANAPTRSYQGHTYAKGGDGQWHLQP